MNTITIYVTYIGIGNTKETNIEKYPSICVLVLYVQEKKRKKKNKGFQSLVYKILLVLFSNCTMATS